MGCFQRARFCVARPFGLLYGRTGTRNEHLCTRRVGHRGVAICYDILDNTSCRHLCTSYRRYAAVWTSFFRSISRKRCLAHRWEHLQQRWQTFTVRTVAALYSVTVWRDAADSLWPFNLESWPFNLDDSLWPFNVAARNKRTETVRTPDYSLR